jgi:hypothetical protein
MFHNVPHHFDKPAAVIKYFRSEIRSGVQPASNDSIMGPADWRYVTSCALDKTRVAGGCRVTLKGTEGREGVGYIKIVGHRLMDFNSENEGDQ